MFKDISSSVSSVAHSSEVTLLKTSGRSATFTDLQNCKRPTSNPNEFIGRQERSERSGHLLRVNCWEGI